MYAISTSTLMAYFAFLAIVHAVLAVLFYFGTWDIGVGYVFDYDVPAWLIAVLDGSAAYLLWLRYRRGLIARGSVLSSHWWPQPSWWPGRCGL
jgi:hypothetical protein